jgi:hypothetical protein
MHNIHSSSSSSSPHSSIRPCALEPLEARVCLTAPPAVPVTDDMVFEFNVVHVPSSETPTHSIIVVDGYNATSPDSWAIANFLPVVTRPAVNIDIVVSTYNLHPPHQPVAETRGVAPKTKAPFRIDQPATVIKEQQPTEPTAPAAPATPTAAAPPTTAAAEAGPSSASSPAVVEAVIGGRDDAANESTARYVPSPRVVDTAPAAVAAVATSVGGMLDASAQPLRVATGVMGAVVLIEPSAALAAAAKLPDAAVSAAADALQETQPVRRAAAEAVEVVSVIATAPQRFFDYAPLHLPYILGADSIAAFTEHSASIPAGDGAGGRVVAVESHADRPWALTGAVVAADVVLLGYIYRRNWRPSPRIPRDRNEADGHEDADQPIGRNFELALTRPA